MEAPTTSAGSAVTLIAPKRAVMIDPGRLTCCSCRITYLPSAVPPLEVVPEDWVCDRCRARTDESSQPG